MYYTYVLVSEKDNSGYIGYSNEVVDRLVQHNAGKSRYTKY